MTSNGRTDYLVIESVEGDIAEVELASGLRTELPAAWLGEDIDAGMGFRVEAGAGALRFVADERAARFVRERNKQTLLDFHDEIE
ncbi:hypothetical protein [Deinococcus yavapaiensis]|uniref:DUF3006 family protein n=1 Tax=Deinococcus yavapaiensis KR-236 TaxID=694435 RepID=A0A318S9K0_9DEIO|nr:hypothetical protein [Deinococcus yavapaiensis]PYE55891.1 hypothetical protein DES52_102257 [Deinococcus yavapaiensis KR-236]